MKTKTKSGSTHLDTHNIQYAKDLLISGKNFSDIIDNVSYGVYVLNTDGYLAYLNDEFLRLFGITRDQIYSIHFLDIIAPEYHELAKRNFQRVMKGEGIPPHEMGYTLSEGQIKIFDSVDSRPIYKGKKIIGVQGVILDVGKHKRVEEALSKSEEKYRAILDNASDPILLADEQGNLIEANRMATNFFGYSREELLQMKYTQLHQITELERVIAAFNHMITLGSGSNLNSAIVRKDGTVVPVDVANIAIEYHGGKFIQASFRDISEHKRIENELEGLVRQRTLELSEKNKQLVKEISERKRVEVELRKNKSELTLHADKLQEMNAALKVLLKQREEDKSELEEKVIVNVKELLLPYLEKLKTSRLDANDEVNVSILEENLNGIISPFTHKLSSKYFGFTPREIQVANLIIQGKSTKDIAKSIGISLSAINLYRNHIRHKLGIITKKVNLRSHLMTFS